MAAALANVFFSQSTTTSSLSLMPTSVAKNRGRTSLGFCLAENKITYHH